MTLLQDFARIMANGIPLLQEIFTEPLSRLESMLRADHAKQLHSLAQVYFGSTAYTAIQEEARAKAVGQEHSWQDLLLIESYAAKLPRKKFQWQLRMYLCGIPSHLIRKQARRKLSELITVSPPPTGVRIRRGRGADPDTLIYTGGSKVVTALYERLNTADPDIAAVALLEGENSRGYTRDEAIAHVVIPIDSLVSAEQGSQDVILTLTNGSRVSGAEYAQMRLRDTGFITLVSPVEGPINLYRTQRHASAKQRLMAAAENPICPWPGCRQPASRSQVHHLTAWKNGGFTNASNLSIACKYHNGINDDDPHVSRRGRLMRQEGRITWIPPTVESDRQTVVDEVMRGD